MRVARRSSPVINCFEFHVSHKTREKYQFDEQLFALNGNVVLADFAAARRFAESMTKVRGQFVPASDINAMGLIDEILHILVRQYEMQNPGVMRRALDAVGLDADAALLKFTEDFPPMAVYRREMDARHYLDMDTAGRPNRAATLEEMLILHITNQNPAVQPYKELFDEEPLKQSSPYEQAVRVLKDFFKGQPGFGNPETKAEDRESLIEVLLAPARVAPHSLSAQLEFLLNHWGVILGESFVLKILRGIDFVKEDALRGNFAGGFAGNVPVLTFTGHDNTEYERFSPDKDWMPRLVLIAKNSYVWLDQLSKKFQRAIFHLDQIPDEELELLQQYRLTAHETDDAPDRRSGFGVFIDGLPDCRRPGRLGGAAKPALARLAAWHPPFC
ncbi:MAG: hypothetical protein NTW99_11280 [Chloroflexi bacterium]|nr:hypothetical protein [Chloroflexota bacterium]